MTTVGTISGDRKKAVSASRPGKRGGRACAARRRHGGRSLVHRRGHGRRDERLRFGYGSPQTAAGPQGAVYQRLRQAIGRRRKRRRLGAAIAEQAVSHSRIGADRAARPRWRAGAGLGQGRGGAFGSARPLRQPLARQRVLPTGRPAGVDGIRACCPCAEAGGFEGRASRELHADRRKQTSDSRRRARCLRRPRGRRGSRGLRGRPNAPVRDVSPHLCRLQPHPGDARPADARSGRHRADALSRGEPVRGGDRPDKRDGRAGPAERAGPRQGQRPPHPDRAAKADPAQRPQIGLAIRPRTRPRDFGSRAAAGNRRGRAGAALPAQGLSGERPEGRGSTEFGAARDLASPHGLTSLAHRRRRGSRSMEPSRPPPSQSGQVHSDGREGPPDRSPHGLGSRDGGRPDAGVDERRIPARRRRQSVSPRCHRPHASRPHRRASPRPRARQHAAGGGSDRIGGDGRRPSQARHLDADSHQGIRAIDGRLRNRLFVAVTALPDAVQRAEDRQVFRGGHPDQQRGSDDRGRHYQARARPRDDRVRGGSRGRGRAGLPLRAELRQGARLSLFGRPVLAAELLECVEASDRGRDRLAV